VRNNLEFAGALTGVDVLKSPTQFGPFTARLNRLRKKACFQEKSSKSIPQWLKPPLIPWLYAGDKSPAYRLNEFFRSL
jgi:hypothetical protein